MQDRVQRDGNDRGTDQRVGGPGWKYPELIRIRERQVHVQAHQ
jgi:hypothetical protein